VLHFNSHENASYLSLSLSLAHARMHAHTHTQCTLACIYAQLHYIRCACMTYGKKCELWWECRASYLSLFVLGAPVDMLYTVTVNTITIFSFTPPTWQQERQSET
jgi:hypothetical protein